MQKNLNDMVDEILQEGPHYFMTSHELVQEITDAQLDQFKVPLPKLGRINKRRPIIKELVSELLIDQKVKSYTKKCIQTNPKLVLKAKVEYMDFTELHKAIKSDKKDILILDRQEPFCKNTEIFAK